MNKVNQSQMGDVTALEMLMGSMSFAAKRIKIDAYLAI